MAVSIENMEKSAIFWAVSKPPAYLAASFLGKYAMDKAIFFDRDGTVIPDRGYLDNVEGVELLPKVGPALKKLSEKGFKLILVTNQSGVGRGRFNLDVVHAQHDRLEELLKPYGVTFKRIKICPHAPDENCDCRKPSPRMLMDCAEELNLDLDRSWMLGDKPSDVQAGRGAGCRTILFNDELVDEADFYTDNMDDAVRIITILDR
jgi:D-glycero-D-manno-heptose 1,7-bisphosphate phosphatase